MNLQSKCATPILDTLSIILAVILNEVRGFYHNCYMKRAALTVHSQLDLPIASPLMWSVTLVTVAEIFKNILVYLKCMNIFRNVMTFCIMYFRLGKSLTEVQALVTDLLVNQNSSMANVVMQIMNMATLEQYYVQEILSFANKQLVKFNGMLQALYYTTWYGIIHLHYSVPRNSSCVHLNWYIICKEIWTRDNHFIDSCLLLSRFMVWFVHNWIGLMDSADLPVLNWTRRYWRKFSLVCNCVPTMTYIWQAIFATKSWWYLIAFLQWHITCYYRDHVLLVFFCDPTINYDLPLQKKSRAGIHLQYWRTWWYEISLFSMWYDMIVLLYYSANYILFHLFSVRNISKPGGVL